MYTLYCLCVPYFHADSMMLTVFLDIDCCLRLCRIFLRQSVLAFCAGGEVDCYLVEAAYCLVVVAIWGPVLAVLTVLRTKFVLARLALQSLLMHGPVSPSRYSAL